MSKKPLQIGITGGIGSGKSVACKIFNILGAPVYDADTRAKWVVNNDQSIKNEVKKVFGDNSFLENGELNRSYISSIVFDDQEKLTILNNIIHPRVALDYQNWVQNHSDYKYTVKEAALLFESGSSKQLDKIIVVTAPESIRISRVLSRDKGRTKKEIQKIIHSQLPEVKKIDKADYVVYNDESKLLITQILELHKQFV